MRDMVRIAWAFVALFMTLLWALEVRRSSDYHETAGRYVRHFEQCRADMAEFHRIKTGWGR